MKSNEARGARPVAFRDAAKLLGVSLVEFQRMEQRLDFLSAMVRRKKVVLPCEMLRLMATHRRAPRGRSSPR